MTMDDSKDKTTRSNLLSININEKSPKHMTLESPSVEDLNNLAFVNRYKGNRSLEKNASIKSIVLPPI
jgi:hypothetical protein